MALMPENLPAGKALILRRWKASMIDELLKSIEASQPELARWLPWADPMPTRTVELEVVRSAERAFAEDWVRSDRTRRGYATLAAGALCNAAFRHLPDVEKVIIRMDQANAASASIPPKLGFSLEGEEASRDALSSGQTGKGWIWSTRG